MRSRCVTVDPRSYPPPPQLETLHVSIYPVSHWSWQDISMQPLLRCGCWSVLTETAGVAEGAPRGRPNTVTVFQDVLLYIWFYLLGCTRHQEVIGRSVCGPDPDPKQHRHQLRSYVVEGGANQKLTAA